MRAGDRWGPRLDLVPGEGSFPFPSLALPGWHPAQAYGAGHELLGWRVPQIYDKLHMTPDKEICNIWVIVG